MSITTKTVKIVPKISDGIMKTEQRIGAFIKLGEVLRALSEDELKRISFNAEAKNSWFTEENVRFSINQLGNGLKREILHEWLNSYDISVGKPMKIGIIMAGNIPMVGFHDLVCTLISGHIALVKLSSEDNYLIKEVIKLLFSIEPAYKERIALVDMLKEADAFIATGSNNSSRYFEYYFSKKPNIIRKNRSSVAILKGDETPSELEKLGEDVFRYYGLGCRNVSKVFIPTGYKPDPIFEALEPWNVLGNHNKFANNYHYNRSIYLLGKEKFFENGFFIIKENEGDLVAPVGVLYMEYYRDQEELDAKIDAYLKDLQCIASSGAWYPNSLDFGVLQRPGWDDYADGVDTLQFLTSLETN